MSVELEALLESERQMGTYESTGFFTLSISEARRKLAHFQLASLEMAVLKLIQSVVQLEPDAIWMESDERGFTLNWAESRTLLEPDQFARNLEQTMLGEPGAAKDMAIGLAGFLDREPAEVWWAYWESQKTVQMVNLFGANQNAQMLPPVGLFRRIHSLRVTAGSASLALERSTIANRTLFCPIPILWNGRLMCELSWSPPGFRNGQAPYWADFYFTTGGPLSQGLALKPIGMCKTLAQWSDQSQRRNFPEHARSFVSLRRYIHGPASVPIRFSGRRPKQTALVETLGSNHEVSLETCLGESMWVVSGAAYAPSALLCLKNGVVLNPCRLPLRLSGMVVVMATPDLEVDLSQFTPLESSKAWAETLEKINNRAKLVVENLQGHSTMIFRENNELVPMTAGAAIVGGLAGGLLSPIFPLGVMLGGAAAGALWVKYAEHQHERRLDLLRGIIKP